MQGFVEGQLKNAGAMKEYAKNPETVSRVVDSHPTTSRQASWDVILQAYAAEDEGAPEETVCAEGKAGPGESNLKAGPNPVQRSVENKQIDEGSMHKGAVEEFFESFNAKVQEAYQYVLTVPRLGPLAGLNGYTRLWLRKWDEYVGGGKPQLLTAAFGYVIETLVCHPNSQFKPDPPEGYTFLMQVPVGGTRPDVVLMEGTLHIAWLDLTASESTDHIFAKEGWDKKISMYAEVTYPSLKPADFQLMCSNKDNTGTIDPATFARMVAEEKNIYARNKAHWLKLGEGFTRTSWRSAITNPRGWSDERFRTFIQKKLKDHFVGVDIRIDMVPSILEAMGVKSTTWGYNTGFSQSVGAGEAWLTDHAPAPVPSSASSASSASSTSPGSLASSASVPSSASSASPSSTASSASVSSSASSTSPGSMASFPPMPFFGSSVSPGSMGSFPPMPFFGSPVSSSPTASSASVPFFGSPVSPSPMGSFPPMPFWGSMPFPAPEDSKKRG